MRKSTRSALIALSLIQTAAVAQAEDRRSLEDAPAAVSRAKGSGQREIREVRSSTRTALDRVAYAVDGAESSHGEDARMWGPDPSGPQGPMQVTEAAAADVGGGDRFDAMQNRALGRAYYAPLYSRYQNGPHAIAPFHRRIGDRAPWVN